MRRAVRITRQAISPRLAMRIFENIFIAKTRQAQRVGNAMDAQRSRWGQTAFASIAYPSRPLRNLFSLRVLSAPVMKVFCSHSEDAETGAVVPFLDRGIERGG